MDYEKSLNEIVAETTRFLLWLDMLGYHILHGFWCSLEAFQDLLDRPIGSLLDWVIYHDHYLCTGLYTVGCSTEVSPQHLLLLSASSYGCLEDVRKLMIGSTSIDVNTRIEDGRTPIMLALQKGHEALVWSLIRRPDIKLNAEDYKSRTTLIFAAIGGLG